MSVKYRQLMSYTLRHILMAEYEEAYWLLTGYKAKDEREARLVKQRIDEVSMLYMRRYGKAIDEA